MRNSKASEVSIVDFLCLVKWKSLSPTNLFQELVNQNIKANQTWIVVFHTANKQICKQILKMSWFNYPFNASLTFYKSHFFWTYIVIKLGNWKQSSHESIDKRFVTVYSTEIFNAIHCFQNCYNVVFDYYAGIEIFTIVKSLQNS